MKNKQIYIDNLKAEVILKRIRYILSNLIVSINNLLQQYKYFMIKRQSNYIQSSPVIKAEIIQHTQSDIHHPQINNQQTNLLYFQEFKKVLFSSFLQTQQFQKIISRNEASMIKLLQLQKNTCSFSIYKNKQGNTNSVNLSFKPDRITKSRIRRQASQIPRKFHCLYQKCGKHYGSQGSLNQHIKLKHSKNESGKIQFCKIQQPIVSMTMQKID